jgi:hypothetical protein
MCKIMGFDNLITNIKMVVGLENNNKKIGKT